MAKIAKIGGNTISWERHIVRSWFTPHFDQNRYISIVDGNIENSRLHYDLQNQPFLAKKWLKWLKMGENTISRERHIVRSWFTPHLDQNRSISVVDLNNTFNLTALDITDWDSGSKTVEKMADISNLYREVI